MYLVIICPSQGDGSEILLYVPKGHRLRKQGAVIQTEFKVVLSTHREEGTVLWSVPRSEATQHQASIFRSLGPSIGILDCCPTCFSLWLISAPHDLFQLGLSQIM